MKRIFLIALLAAIGLLARAQQTPTAQNVRVTAPETEFFSGMKGLKIEFDLGFSAYSESYFARSFEVDFMLVTKAGEVVYDSKKSGAAEKISADKPKDPKSPHAMVALGVDLFAPYRDIHLPTGTQTLFLILSMHSEAGGDFRDFHKQEITFQHQYMEAKSFADQEFTCKAPEIEYNVKGFGVDEPGMNLKFEFGMKYGADQVDTDEYKLNLRIYSPDGSKLYYSSADDPSVHHKSPNVDTEDFPGAPAHLKYFVSYVALKMNAPGDALVVLEAEESEKDKREVYRKVHALQTPLKYRFDQQEFKPSDVQAVRTMKHGVTGLKLSFHCDYKYTSPLIDAERGDYYFFLVVLKENGDTAFSPTWLRRLDYSTTQPWDAHNPLMETGGGEVEMFVPMHRMKLTQGTHALKYMVYVTDRARRARFPMVASGNLQVEQPRILSYELRVTHLEVIPGNYDAQVAVFGNLDPDLEWRLEVGADTEYQSTTRENSLIAASGTCQLRLCEGDPINLGLWDIDSGIFNRNDGLGVWTIPYAGKGEQYKHHIESQGAIRVLDVEVLRK